MFVWIILHYETFELTVNQITNILKTVNGEKQIIVVDNASPNGSGKALFEKYSDNKLVKVILLKKNLGFAQGNNVGYREALTLNPRFIIFTNNDVRIDDPDIQNEVLASYLDNKFAVMGPDIYVPDTGIHQNPKFSQSISADVVQQQVCKSQKILDHPFLLQIRALLKQFRGLKRLVYSVRRRRIPKIDNDNMQTDVTLHGAFVVVSRQFMEGFQDWAFFPETFFYYEMEIQALFLKKNSMLSVYDPSIKVVHFQNASTKVRYQHASERLKFQATQMKKSGEIFLNVAEQLK